MADCWTKFQSINFGGISPKRGWGDYVEQFMMVLDDTGGDDETGVHMQMAMTSQGVGL